MSSDAGEGTSNRRVVVVRNPNNPNVHQGPVDLSEYENGDGLDLPAVFSDGRKSVYLLRRPIPPTKPDSNEESMDHRSPTTPPPVPPLPSDLGRSPSPRQSPTPLRPKSSKPMVIPAKSSEAKSMTQTSIRGSTRRKTVPSSSSSPSNGKPAVESRSSPSWMNHEPESSRLKSAYRKKSAKSMVFVNPEDHSVAVIEPSSTKVESIRPITGKRPKSTKKIHFRDGSREQLVEGTESRGCLGCLSRFICLIIIICIVLIVIGLAGVGVSAYFLAIDSTTNLIPKIVGICVGGVLAIATICFLYIVLACIGAREGYFTYTNNDATRSYSGRAYALIPPSHRNAHLYIPHDYSQMTESSYATTVVSPVSTVPVNHSIVPLTHRSAAKPNITIEVPERLLTGRKLSPRSRERSLNKVVKNLGHIVEDAKKHCNGDMPSKVIVKVDDHIDGK